MNNKRKEKKKNSIFVLGESNPKGPLDIPRGSLDWGSGRVSPFSFSLGWMSPAQSGYVPLFSGVLQRPCSTTRRGIQVDGLATHIQVISAVEMVQLDSRE
jgi:hypothetical protein